MRGRTLGWGAAVLALAMAPALASVVVGLSIEDQARLAKLVVVGEVVTLRGLDHPDLGIETAVTLRVHEALKGQAATETEIVFHTRQGRVGEVESQVPGEASFHVGQKALVFIEEVDGRLYNLGLSMGVWSVLERDGAVSGYTRAIRDGLEVVGEEEVELGPIAYQDMLARVARAVKHPELESPALRAIRAAGR